MKLSQKITGVVGVLCLVLGVVRLWFPPAALAVTTAPPEIVITETDPASPNPVGVNDTFEGTLDVNPTDSEGHKEDFSGDTEITWAVVSVTKDGTEDNSLISQINPGGDSQTASYSGSFTNGGVYEIQFQATASNPDWSDDAVSPAFTVTVTVESGVISANMSPAQDQFIAVDDTVVFSSDPSGGCAPYTYVWTFNGGTPSNSANQNPGAVNFDINALGQNTCTLTVTDKNNVQNTDNSSINVTVINVATFDESIQDQYMEIAEISGSCEVNYTDADSGAKLRQVLIEPPYDSEKPYTIGSDFYGTVDSTTGNVNLTFNRDGAYIVKIIRDDDSEEYVQVWFNTGAWGLDKITAWWNGPVSSTYAVPAPVGDLKVVSSYDPTPNRPAYNSTLQGVPGVIRVDYVNDICNEIINYYARVRLAIATVDG